MTLFEPGETYISVDGHGLAVYRPTVDSIFPWIWSIEGVEKARFATLSLAYMVAKEYGMELEPFTI